MSPRRLSFFLPALVVFFVATRSSPAAEAQIRVALITPQDLAVGQRATLKITVVVPGYFASSPVFDLPSVPGLVILPPTDYPVLGTEEIDGVSCTTQLHDLSLFARRAGEFEIPSFTVRFEYKPSPLAKETIAQTLETSRVSFEAKLPSGAENLGDLISTTSLRVEETWTPRAPDQAQTGDAFTRVITFRAVDVPGMAFPPFHPGQIAGLAVYPKPPEVRDEGNRGDLTGVRVETIAYVCQEAGRVTIPAVRLSWWDTAAKKLRTVDLPAYHFDVALDPASAKRLTEARRRERIADALPGIAAAALGLALVWLAIRLGALRAFRAWAASFNALRLPPLNPPANPR